MPWSYDVDVSSGLVSQSWTGFFDLTGHRGSSIDDDLQEASTIEVSEVSQLNKHVGMCTYRWTIVPSSTHEGTLDERGKTSQSTGLSSDGRGGTITRACSCRNQGAEYLHRTESRRSASRCCPGRVKLDGRRVSSEHRPALCDQRHVRQSSPGTAKSTTSDP
jgi:hypothetical protein